MFEGLGQNVLSLNLSFPNCEMELVILNSQDCGEGKLRSCKMCARYKVCHMAVPQMKFVKGIVTQFRPLAFISSYPNPRMTIQLFFCLFGWFGGALLTKKGKVDINIYVRAT